ncbi:extensin [Streptomyces sp. TS71-3]|uniref:extensin n=1 Tax=Streptomyces sp. TS71-3 TaxID=2733862 RepID=UPI001B163813|nr:extensin [Streptomyces sp. TS71-3]GHJ35460.1 hypothetical protein Sm713_10690 [Streptomyces sp. TS71-3]
MNRQIPIREAVALLRTMTRVLCAVGFLALIFTTVNVTRFATSRDVPLPIAILLDPMIGTTLAGVLYMDAHLAAWGITPPAWSTTLRWGAGCTAALMNTWESLWPDRHIGWPDRADPAAVLLHLTPALLLIALTETIAAYRRCLTDLVDRTSWPVPAEQPERRTADPAGSAQERGDQPCPATDHHHSALPQNCLDDELPCARHTPGPGAPMDEGGVTDTDLWSRAVSMNNTARTASGKPVSVWKLRTELRIGPRRARQIHERLLTHTTDPQL